MSKVYYGYWLVGASFIAQFVSVGAQNYVIGAFFKPMTEELDWSRTEFTLSRTIGQFFFAFIGLYIGTHVDRRGGRALMQVGVIILAVAMVGTSYVEELWQWWLLNGLMLTAGSAMIGNLVVNVTLARWFIEKRGRVVGFAAMGVSFAGVLLTPLSTALVDDIGWRAAWRVLAVGAAVIVIPISFIMRRAPEDHGLFPDGMSAEEATGTGARATAAAADMASSLTRSEAMHTAAFYLIVFGFGFGVISIGMMLVQTIPFMTDAGYDRDVAAFMITVTSIPALLSKPVWGWLIDKASPQKLAAVGFVLNAIAMVMIVFTVRAGATPLVYLSFFILGLGWGGLIPLQEVIWASFFGRRHLGAVRSAGLPFTLMMGAASPLLSAMYFDRVGNYDGAFLTVAALALVAVVLTLRAKPPVGRSVDVRGAHSADV